ncbi:MAG: FliG C-terminal domain-containing protein [Planctomycetaceae bacterium]
MTKAREASLRRIAIVLESLPESVAQRLLGTLQTDSQRQVRLALGSLSDVDPLERRRALDGFANSLRQGKTSPSSDAAEVVFSRAAIRNLNERTDEPVAPASTSPLGFLLDVEDEALVAHLSGELPQTLAIILASISPAQAARVLPRLDVSVRAEAMRRMANLHEMPGELIDEIGTQLRRRLVPSGGQAGKRALDAIMAEMQDTASPPQPSPRFPASAFTASDVMPPATELENHHAAGRDSQDRRQPNVKLAEGTWPEPEPDDAMAANAQKISKSSAPLNSTESVHAYLISQPSHRLRDGLARVSARQALLALCGLPKATAESVLASLPRRQAKQVRDQMTSLGSLELREIDDAKRAVATELINEHAAVPSMKMAAAA